MSCNNYKLENIELTKDQLIKMLDDYDNSVEGKQSFDSCSSIREIIKSLNR